MAQTKNKTAELMAAKRSHNAAILVWISQNRGVMTQIANSLDPPVKPNYVGMILSGKRKGVSDVGQAVLKALKKAGAPIEV